jgi:chemotaxis protein methyltransferase CheR
MVERGRHEDVVDEGRDEGLEALEIRLFLDAIFARYGYDLRGYSPSSMRRRVRTALAKSGRPNLGALQHGVLTDAQLFARVLGDLTVPVSALFRDPDFYRAFRERVVPVLRTYPFVNVWHAGCATGEEAYSTAIVLREEGLYERCQLYATDLSVEALERAKQGVYGPRDLAVASAGYRRAGGLGTFADHATLAYEQLALPDSLRSRILFFQHSLVSDHVFAEMQVIFCRNVLIYFGPELRARVMRKLAQSLCRGGFLCLGSSERLPVEMRGSFVEVAGTERIYRHEGSP